MQDFLSLLPNTSGVLGSYITTSER